MDEAGIFLPVSGLIMCLCDSSFPWTSMLNGPGFVAAPLTCLPIPTSEIKLHRVYVDVAAHTFIHVHARTWSFVSRVQRSERARTQLAGAQVLHECCSRARCKFPLTAPGAIFRATCMMRVSSSHRCLMGVPQFMREHHHPATRMSRCTRAGVVRTCVCTCKV